MDLGLQGKVAVVTGGSRGIGLYTARALGAEGARLALCARNRDGLEAAAESLRAEGVADVLTVVCDIAREDGAARLIEATRNRYGRLDVLVNNVGGNRRGTFEETNDEDWLDVIQLNVLSGFRASRLAIPLMREAGGGSIIFISSVFGREKGGPGLSIYNTTKTALISAAGIMALELARGRHPRELRRPRLHPVPGRKLGPASAGEPRGDARVRQGEPAPGAVRAR